MEDIDSCRRIWLDLGCHYLHSGGLLLRLASMGGGIPGQAGQHPFAVSFALCFCASCAASGASRPIDKTTMQFVLRGKGLRVPDDDSRVVEHRMVAEGGFVSRGTDRSLSICAEKPVPKLPYDITTNVVWLDIQTTLIIIRDVATGRRIMAMIISLPGFGKTFLAKREMRKAHCAFHSSNPQDANALVNVLWRLESGALRNSKGELIAVLLLDDADACARRETAANVVKGAFGEARRVVWESQAAFSNAARLDRSNPRYNPHLHSPLIPPMEFNVSLRSLWLTECGFHRCGRVGGNPRTFPRVGQPRT